jgi:predicted negative regulator of RcsB-dependent stress response
MIEELKKSLGHTHHLILKLKLDYILLQEGKNDAEIHNLVIEYCQDLMPIIEKLDGDLSHVKGRVSLKLAQTQIAVWTQKFKDKIVNKDEYMTNMKAVMKRHMEARKLIVS